MGRVQLLLGVGGVIVIVLFVLAALLRRARDRGARSGGMDLDGLGMEEGGSVASPAERPGIHPDFRALLERIVLPRLEAHPGWGRLDGAEGVPGRSIALFDHGGTVYAVNGESRSDALMATWRWMEANPGKDPLMVQPSKGRRGQLALRPEIGVQDRRAIRIETE